MASFDPATFAQGLVGPLQDAVQANLGSFKEDAQDVLDRTKVLASDVRDVLSALAVETDPVKVQALRDDLALFLPARRAAIMAIVASHLASDVQATFDAVLFVVVKAAVVAAKSFL